MSNVIFTLKQHTRLCWNHPYIAIICLLLVVNIMHYSYINHAIPHAVAYLFAIWLSMFIIDLYINAYPVALKEIPIKKPVKLELVTIVTCALLGLVYLCFRYYSDWDHMNPLLKLSLLPLLLFTFPVALAVIYVFFFKYKPAELGLNLNYWYLALVVHIIIGGATLLIAPQKSVWKEAFQTMGLPGMLFTGLIVAALSEEFTRMLMQTRISKLVSNSAVGVFSASLYWALMHIPTFGRENAAMPFTERVNGAICILPIGFLWGYMTYRTKSIVPSILMHGLNFWGLQNI